MTTLYVSDLDGTLLGAESKLTDESVRLLNDAISNGVMFSVATARTPATVSRLLADVDCRVPLIVMTGAAIWDRKRNCYTHACFHNVATARRLVSTYKEYGLSTFVYALGEDDVIHIYHIGAMSDLEWQFVNERADTPFKSFHIPESGVSDIPDDCMGRVLLFYSMRPTEEVSKVHNIIKDDSDLRAVFYHDIFGAETALMEVFGPDASKANAVRILAESVSADRIVAYGDNINDLPILEIADDAVAVENAVDKVKEIADRIIGANTTDAVAKDIRNSNLAELSYNPQIIQNLDDKNLHN